MINNQFHHKTKNYTKVGLRFPSLESLKERDRGGVWWLWGLWLVVDGGWW